LRPEQNIDINCKLGKSNKLPVAIFYKDEYEFEDNLIGLIRAAVAARVDLKDFAILSPTRGRMRSNGKSNGLCLVSNILFKHGIKFKQFYEEALGEISNAIRYEPEKGHINVLTYMGSKGLEWKYTIIIDADSCLINKREFNEEKHKCDQYLLYVACSRAITNLFIFSKYVIRSDNVCSFTFNPWFANVPEKYYIRDIRYKDVFEFTTMKDRISTIAEKKITKILDNCPEQDLYELATLCNFGIDSDICAELATKKITSIYTSELAIQGTMFASKYIKELYYAYYNIANGLPAKQYHDIDVIINMDVIVSNNPNSKKFILWYYQNRYELTWQKYDEEKDTYEPFIVSIIDTYFTRTKELSEFVIIPDCYFKSYILSNLDSIKQSYEKFKVCVDVIDVRKYLFDIVVLLYSLETQHYFHVGNGGANFKYVLKSYSGTFDKVYLFICKGLISIKQVDLVLHTAEFDCGIDFIDEDDNIYEIKNTPDISLKHIVNQIAQYALYHKLYNKNGNKVHNIQLNFIQLFNGNIVTINVALTLNKIREIFAVLRRNRT